MVKVMVTVGDVFGHLTLVSHFKNTRWNCKCICGNTVVVQQSKLLKGNNKSCGCKQFTSTRLGDAARTHGRANSRIGGYKDRTYGIWQAMRQRCSNPKHICYHRYGGRGIKVCDRWNDSFEAFVEDMGNAKDRLTIDRIDNDKGYYKENCRWATYKQQAQNRKYRVKLVNKQIGEC